MNNLSIKLQQLNRILIVLLCLFYSENAFSQNFNWANSIGGISVDKSFSSVLDVAGNIYVTGSFKDTVDFDPGPGVSLLGVPTYSDIFVSKYNANGGFVWAKKLEGTTTNSTSKVTIDNNGNVITVGHFVGTADLDPGLGIFNLVSNGAEDMFISKLDSNGNFVWAKSIGGALNDYCESVICDTLGNIFTTGFFYGTTDFDPGSGVVNLVSAGYADMFVSKLDINGNLVWVKQISGNHSVNGYAVKIDSDGDIYTAGRFLNTVDFDPGTAVVTLTSFGSWDVFVCKLDTAGNFIWAKKMGGASSEILYSMTLDGNGNIYSTGVFNDTADFNPSNGVENLISKGISDVFISKLDSNGDFVWAKSIGGNSYDYSASVAVDDYGDVYTTGIFYNTVDFDPGTGMYNLTSMGNYDIFISKLTTDGNFVWAERLGGASSEYCKSINVDVQGNVVLAGYYSGTVDFDPSVNVANKTSAGGSDFYILKLSQSYCQPSFSTQTVVACDSFLWSVNGQTYSNSGISKDTSFNYLGCDSIVILNLTINHPTYVIDSIITCDSLTWINGTTYYSNNNTDTFVMNNIAGCDSIVTLNLTINHPTYTTDSIVTCDSLTWINGTTYYSNNNTDTFVMNNIAGCDSIISLKLIINMVDESVTTTDPTIVSNAVGANYQWLDCDNNYASLTADTNKIFTASQNGNYAVQVSKNNCVDTSVCISIISTKFIENSTFSEVKVFPNPNDGIVYIQLGKLENVCIKVLSVTGQTVYYEKNIQSSLYEYELKGAAGVYFIELSLGKQIRSYKIIKR